MNPYECMYVIPKERYEALLKSSPSTHGDSLSTITSSPSTLCPLDGKDFGHPNILAHHLKAHLDGIKCNICAKVFKNKSTLKKHLTRHAAEPRRALEPETALLSSHSSLPPLNDALKHTPIPTKELHCSVCSKKMKHKRNLYRHMKTHQNIFKLKIAKWESLN